MTKKQLRKENKILKQGFKDLVYECTEKIENKNKLFDSEINRFNDIHNKQFNVAEKEIKRLNVIINYLENKDA